MDKLFHWKNSTISYTVIGNGEKQILAFHGYGQTKESFHEFESILPPDYQIIAVDLPFHGETIWKGKEMVEREEMKQFSSAFLEHLDIHKPFSVMAYSIGGNFALSVAYHFAEWVDKIYLFAADGLKFKPGFWFVTRTLAGKWLFKGFVQFPGPAVALIKLLNGVGIYPDKLRHFFLKSIETKELRIAIYKRWRSVARFGVPKRELIRRLNKHKVALRLYFGKYDKVIPLRNAVQFNKKLKQSKLTIIEDGHQLINKKTLEYFKEEL